jgi:hypothetical protein
MSFYLETPDKLIMEAQLILDFLVCQMQVTRRGKLFLIGEIDRQIHLQILHNSLTLSLELADPPTKWCSTHAKIFLETALSAQES